MEAAVAKLRDAEYTFHQLEVVDGELQPQQVIQVKFRRPHDVYMTWIGEAYTGRQLVFRRGMNNGKLMVDPGPWIPSLWLDPLGSLASAGQRHSVNEVGFVAVAKLYVADTNKIEADPTRFDPEVTDEGVTVEYGESVHCFTTLLPKDVEPSFYSLKARTCFSERSDLPVRVQAWDNEDGKVMMVEDYGYEDTRVNVGLVDLDFDPNNPAYGF